MKKIVNVEKNELNIRKTPFGYKLKEDYKDKPKHPASGINPKGNTNVMPNDIIIPAKHRDIVLKALKTSNKNPIDKIVNNLKVIPMKKLDSSRKKKMPALKCGGKMKMEYGGKMEDSKKSGSYFKGFKKKEK